VVSEGHERRKKKVDITKKSTTLKASIKRKAADRRMETKSKRGERAKGGYTSSNCSEEGRKPSVGRHRHGSERNACPAEERRAMVGTGYLQETASMQLKNFSALRRRREPDSLLGQENLD